MTSEKSEVEALVDVAVQAVNEAGGSAEARTDVSRVLGKVVDVVAVAVRAQDRARGGTLSAEELETSFEVIGLEWPNGVREIKSHMAAQGRTIAALQEKAERWEEEAEAQTARAGLAEKECDEARATIAARDERIAALEAEVRDERQRRERNEAALVEERDRWIEVAPLGPDESQPEDAERNLHRLGEKLRAAESALATLRHAVAPLVSEIRAYDPDATSTLFYARDSEPGPEVLARSGVDALLAAYDATPAPEHPDTAALRAIRERAKDREAMGRAVVAGFNSKRAEGFRLEPWEEQTMPARLSFADAADAVRDYLLGGSGQSGGGEHVAADDGACSLTCAACLNEPTTPPDVAVDADWRTVERYLSVRGGDDTDEALAAIARLKDAPRKAAEAMRERCAQAARDCQPAAGSPEWRAAQAAIEETIRALPLD